MDDYQYSFLRQSVFSALDTLDQASQELINLLTDDIYDCWLYQHQPEDYLRVLANIVGQYDYKDDQDPNDVKRLTGVVVVSSAVIDQIHLVNHYKNCIKATLESIPNQRIYCEDSNRKIPVIKYIIKDIGRARIHWKQVKRHLHVIDKMPAKISFSKSNSPRVYRINVKRAKEMLGGMAYVPVIKEQLNLLAALPDDMPIARLKSQHKLIANIAWNIEYEMQKNASLPLFIPGHVGQKLPVILADKLEKPKSLKRARRSDRKIQEDPFLPSINGYRYC